MSDIDIIRAKPTTSRLPAEWAVNESHWMELPYWPRYPHRHDDYVRRLIEAGLAVRVLWVGHYYWPADFMPRGKLHRGKPTTPEAVNAFFEWVQTCHDRSDPTCHAAWQVLAVPAARLEVAS